MNTFFPNLFGMVGMIGLKEIIYSMTTVMEGCDLREGFFTSPEISLVKTFIRSQL